MIDRNELGEKIFTDIYSVIIDNGLNIDPLANELGDEIDDFVELILDYSEGNEDKKEFKCHECGTKYEESFCSTDDVAICRWCSGEEEESGILE